MEKIIVLLVLLFEIGITVFCIAKKSRHDKVKHIIRIVAFVLFVILCITTLIEFDLRWYSLGMVLLISAVLSIIKLLRKRKNTKPFRKGKAILTAIGMCVILFLSLVPALLFPQYTIPQTTGEFEVETINYTYTEGSTTDITSSNSYVNVAFWYPKTTKGSFPLVVFDHGAFGIKDSNYSMYQELASQGYVVCSIDHPGHSFYTESEQGKIALVNMEYLREVNYSNTTACTASEGYEYIQDWMKVRVADMNFTIDTILYNVNQDNRSKPYDLINTDKIGVFGHSMGAASSVWIGREREDVDAVINIDGPYFSEIVYDETTDEICAKGLEYDKPILNIYSDQVWNQIKDGSDTGVYAGNKISNKICAESFNLYLEGAKHLTLTDLALVSPFLTDMLNGERATIDINYCMRIEREAILEFFNCYLKDGPAYTKTGTYSSDNE